MLDQPQRWATMTNFGHSNRGVREYFITGKTPPGVKKVNTQIKQKIMLLKMKEKELKLNIGSSLQNNINKRLPMDYNREATIRALQNRKTMNHERLKTAQKDSTDSQSLRSYSQKLFDDVVLGQNKILTPKVPQTPRQTISNGLQNGQQTLRLSQPSVQTRPHTARNNGPSSENSIYHNKGMVLNSIRLRPQSEPPSRYNHQKGKTISPEIQKTLYQSNNDFRVLATTPTSSCNGTRPSSFRSGCSTVSDFLLVPIDRKSSEHPSNTDTELSLNLDTCSDSVFHDGITEESNNGTAAETERSQISSSKCSYDLAFRQRNMATEPVHFYSLEYESSSEGSIKAEETKPPPVEEPPPPPPPEEPRPKSGAKKGKGVKGKSKGKPRSAGKKKGKEPVEKPPPTPEVVQPEVVVKPVVKKPLKGPKCWVDDATITSNIDPADQEGVLNDPELNPPEQQGPVTKTVTIKDTPRTIPPEGMHSPIDPSANHPNQNAETHLPGDMTPNHLNECPQDDCENDIFSYLPRYICPSSVKKSKDAAIKNWLASTDFCHAKNTVPLL